MAISFSVIDTTVGGANSNSYGTVQELRDYFAHRSEASEFLALSDDVLTARLIQATLINDTVLTAYGEISSDEQSLEFPRKGLVDKHGREYADNVIPNQIKWAEFEQAFYCNTNNIHIPSIITQGFSHAKLDVMSVTVDKDFIPNKLAYEVVDYLSLFGTVNTAQGNGMKTLNVVRY